MLKNSSITNTHYLDLFINNPYLDFTKDTPINISIGNFDGLHRGHLSILGHIINKKDPSTKSLAISFNSSLGSIFNTSQKLSSFKELGIDYSLILPYSIRSLSYNTFLSFLELFNLKSIVVGENFRFGNLREGSYLNLIQKFKDIVQIPSYIKDPVSSKIISSTRIKTEILNKNILSATDMLDHFLILEGKIIPGIHEASSLGIPTINISPHSLSLPKGVYLGYSYLTNTSLPDSIESLYDSSFYYEHLYDLDYKIHDINDNNSNPEINIVIRVHRLKTIDAFTNYILVSNSPTNLSIIPSLIHIGTRPTLEKILNQPSSDSSILVESHLLLEKNSTINTDVNNIYNHSYNYSVFYIKDFIAEEKTFPSKKELVSALNLYKTIAKNKMKL